MTNKILFQDIPYETDNEKDFIVFKTRVCTAWQHYLDKTGMSGLPLSVASDTEKKEFKKAAGTSKDKGQSSKNSVSLEKRAEQYNSRKPDFLLEQLIVPKSVKDELLLASQIKSLENLIFDEWGLRSIQPFPYSALNFYGEPGTGKTLAAHALASYLGCNILLASYAQIESMYHGEGPKNVEALFYAAERDNAVLFIDEADSLLSKRLTNVSQGSEQAINSMRSQLLISLERFKGIVIFATNLVENYDRAFETRVRNIYFPIPDKACRESIWRTLLPKRLPLSDDVSIEKLAEIDDVCGRDIRNAIIDSAFKVAMCGEKEIKYTDLIGAIYNVKDRRVKKDITLYELTDKETQAVAKAISK